MPYEQDTPFTLSNFAARDINRIVGEIKQSLAQRSVWTNLTKGGVFPKGTGDTIRSIVQLPAFTNTSYANPGLTDFTAICGDRGVQSKVSNIEYLTKLQSLRGRGPDICVNQGFGAFAGWMQQAVKSLKDDIVVIRDAIDRSAAWKISATKFTALSTATFPNRLTGGTEADVGVLPLAALPDSPISFAQVRTLATYAREVLFAEAYTMKVTETGGYDQFSVFVGSQEIIDLFRKETAVQQSLNALTTGGFKFGEKALTSMNFQTAGAWQGIAMKPDQFPLRYNVMAAGQPVFIEPFIEVVDDLANNKSHKRVNPAWLGATYEIAFLMHNDTYERLVPEKYTGEGDAKFDPRLSTGELVWTYRPNQSENLFGDYGFHRWELTQAYRPIRPHHLITMLYERCAPNELIICP
jgi:hypothetical protein